VLRYALWFQAIDFSNPQRGGTIADGIELRVDGSADGGKTWVKLDVVDGAEPRWRAREVALDGKIPTDGKLVVRFTVENPDATTLVEAGVDDFEIITQTQACNPNAVVGMPEGPSLADGGCAVGGRAPRAPLAFALLLLALLAGRRRSKS
jgi:MYXO-CTERM domain-containing protein